MKRSTTKLSLALCGLALSSSAHTAKCSEPERPPLHLALDGATKLAIVGEQQEAARLAANYATLTEGTNHSYQAERILDAFANSRVKDAVTNSIAQEVLPLFSPIHLKSYPIALAEGDLNRKFQIGLGVPKPVPISLNFSNSSSYSFRLTNGNPRVFLPEYRIKQQPLMRLMKATASANQSQSLFFPLPREIDYFPEVRYKQTGGRGAGAKVTEVGVNLSGDSENSAAFSHSFQERTDDDYFGLFFFVVNLSKLTKMTPLSVIQPEVLGETPPMKCANKALAIGGAFAFQKISPEGTCEGTNCSTITLTNCAFYAVVPIISDPPVSSTKSLAASVFVDVIIPNNKHDATVTVCLPARRKRSEKPGTAIVGRIADNSLFSLELQPTTQIAK